MVHCVYPIPSASSSSASELTFAKDAWRSMPYWHQVPLSARQETTPAAKWSTPLRCLSSYVHHPILLVQTPYQPEHVMLNTYHLPLDTYYIVVTISRSHSQEMKLLQFINKQTGFYWPACKSSISQTVDFLKELPFLLCSLSLLSTMVH